MGMQTYDPSDMSSPKFTGSGCNTHVAYATQTGGLQGHTHERQQQQSGPGRVHDLPAIACQYHGLIVDVIVSENNFPDVTGVSRNAIGQGTPEVELHNLASGGIGAYLATVFITRGGTGRLTFPP
jgi:hypothetical protein